MKRPVPQSNSALNRDKLIVVLFSPLLACVVFSALVLGLNASAWAEGDDDRSMGSVESLRESFAEHGDVASSDDAKKDFEASSAHASESSHDDRNETAFGDGVQVPEESSSFVVNSVQALTAELLSARAEFELAAEAFQGLIDDADNGPSDRDADALVEDEQKAAFSLLQTARRQMIRMQGPDVLEVLSNVSSLQEAIESRDLLERLIVFQQHRFEGLCKKAKLLKASKLLEGVDAAILEREIDATIQEVNAHAAALEILCASARRQLGQTYDALSDTPAQTAISNAVGALAECERSLAQWYDSLERLAGLEGGVSFGTGRDFALSEDEFVQKWGTIIDAFFLAQEVGEILPLQGFGTTMARAAFQHKVDPRLCAAVSIVESSGGRFCIKAHNAWGWGAADCDPEGLAVQWDSFDEGIRAWHEGVSSSTGAFASSGCLSDFAATYCSSSTWCESVLELMREMDSLGS